MIDFDGRTRKLLKEIFGDTNGPITTTGQKILIAQLLPDDLVETVNKELLRNYNDGWTDAINFFTHFSAKVEQLLSESKDRDEPPRLIVTRAPKDVM